MNDRHVVAIIQARMGSTRLPEKVMRSVAGRPMIHHVVERVQQITGVDEVVVATSTKDREKPLVEYVESMAGVKLFRGPEHDVLRRYAEAAEAFSADVVMRITGDCPLLSPRVSAQVLQAFLRSRERCDYATNTLQRTFPRGLDTAVMSVDTLRTAHREATTPQQREHVTVYIWTNPQRFELVGVRDEVDRHHLRWTVDRAEDLRFVQRVYDALYHPSSLFEYEDVLALLEEHPQWIEINRGVRQKPIWK